MLLLLNFRHFKQKSNLEDRYRASAASKIVQSTLYGAFIRDLDNLCSPHDIKAVWIQVGLDGSVVAEFSIYRRRSGAENGASMGMSS